VKPAPITLGVTEAAKSLVGLLKYAVDVTITIVTK
jgi:hypothetical protein